MSDLTPRWFENIETKSGIELAIPIVKIVFLAWIPAQAIWFIVQQIHPGPSDDMAYLTTPFRAITSTMLIAPVLETYVMRFFFYWVGKFIKTQTWVNVVSAVLWGTMHWNSESWGLHAVWAFFVMGICFLRLRNRSTQHALYVTMIVHAIFNALSYGLYLMPNPWHSV